MTLQTYKFVKTSADANGAHDVGNIVQLDDASPAAVSLLASGTVVKVDPPRDGSVMPSPTDPAPRS